MTYYVAHSFFDPVTLIQDVQRESLRDFLSKEKSLTSAFPSCSTCKDITHKTKAPIQIIVVINYISASCAWRTLKIPTAPRLVMEIQENLKTCVNLSFHSKLGKKFGQVSLTGNTWTWFGFLNTQRKCFQIQSLKRRVIQGVPKKGQIEKKSWPKIEYCAAKFYHEHHLGRLDQA